MNLSGGLRLSYLVLCISAAVQFAVFWAWPGVPDADVVHSIFAAYNFARDGQLHSVNLFPPPTTDLAKLAQVYWMSHWPPAHSWLYAALMWWGMSAGIATKILGLFCVLVGGIGWIKLTQRLGGSDFCAAFVAFASAWIFFMARVYIDYKNDHLACALAPWVYLGLLQLAAPLGNFGGWRLFGVGLLAGVPILVKYSLVPFLVAAGFYVLWLELRSSRPLHVRFVRLAQFSIGLVLPALLLWLANYSWGLKLYPAELTGGFSLGLPTFLGNIVSFTFGSPTGWNLLVIQLNIALETRLGISLIPGTLAAISFGFVALWIVSFARTKWTATQLEFVRFLLLLTVMLWMFLYALTVTSAIGYNFAGDSRFYFPVGFAWLVVAAISLEKLPWRKLIRSVRFYSLLIPLLFSFFFYAREGVFGNRYAALPNSGIALGFDFFNQRDGDFLSNLMKARGRGPDIIVTREWSTMIEVGVPTYWRFVNPALSGYYSSRDMEIWAMLRPQDEKTFLAKFSKAASIEKLQTPRDFPFKFYIAKFRADRRPST